MAAAVAPMYWPIHLPPSGKQASKVDIDSQKQAVMEWEPGKRLANRGFSINHNQSGKAEGGGFKAARFLSKSRSIAPFALEATPQPLSAYTVMEFFKDQSVDSRHYIELCY